MKKFLIIFICMSLIAVVIAIDFDKMFKSIAGDTGRNIETPFEWKGIYIPHEDGVLCEVDEDRNAISVYKKGSENIFLMIVIAKNQTPDLNAVLRFIQKDEKYISHEYISIDGQKALAISVKYVDDPKWIVAKEYHIEGSKVFIGYHGDEENVDIFERLLGKIKLSLNID